MKLSISNIAWATEFDSTVYDMMREMDYVGLEIAPTKIFPDSPYDKNDEAKKWAEELKSNYGFFVPSMQSIWYGRKELLFGSDEERDILLNYTKKAIVFAETIGCGNLVFGCPRNRVLPEDKDAKTAVSFFRELGEYAAVHNTVIGMEANPPIYNTNYINDTMSAFELIKEVDSTGFLLNLDIGTMIENNESISLLKNNVKYINHVHISEPNLARINKRDIHKELAKLLCDSDYIGFVSIEVGRQDDIKELAYMMDYVREIFG